MVWLLVGVLVASAAKPWDGKSSDIVVGRTIPATAEVLHAAGLGFLEVAFCIDRVCSHL